VERHRTRLHQQLRELRASARRGLAQQERHVGTAALVLERKGAATAVAVERGAARAEAAATALERGAGLATARRARDLERLRLSLAAHDPQRTLERGYALVEDPSGEPLTTVATALACDRLTVRMSDGALSVRPES
jgi:exodeoxyribonuclease VII large subunit